MNDTLLQSLRGRIGVMILGLVVAGLSHFGIEVGPDGQHEMLKLIIEGLGVACVLLSGWSKQRELKRGKSG